MDDIVGLLLDRAFRLATRDFNGNGARLAKEAAEEILRLRAENEKLRAAMHEIYEVYAGGEGFIPQTSVEACLHERVNKIADIAAKHLLCAASKETE